MISSVLRGAFCAVLLFISTVSTFAQDVILNAKSGSLKVEGKLSEFDGEFYTVETTFGPVIIDARTVVCSGDGCPVVDSTVAEFSIFSNDLLAYALLESFTMLQESEIELKTEQESETTTLIVKSGTAGVLAEINLKSSSVDDPYAVLTPETDALVFSSLPANDNLQTKTIALDGIVVGKSAANPVDAISDKQIRDILAGAITNWKDLGGSDTEINLHLAPADAGFVAKLVMMDLLPAEGVPINEHEDMAKLADEVASDPFGIAIMPFSALGAAKPMNIRGTCGMHSSATQFSLKSGSYPMTYPVHVSWPQKRLPLFVREFLEFLETERAQKVIADFGYANIGISTHGLEGLGQRLVNSLMIIGREVPLKDVREMTTIMSGAKRLSLTFRFTDDAAKLDTQSQENIRALAGTLSIGNYADKVVYLMGFSDGDGRALRNKALSKDRAETVKSALIKAAPEGALEGVEFVVLGFGEASPLVCEDSVTDLKINRRVEVWVKDRS